MITSGKPWKQRVLSNKEVEFINKCYKKLERAYLRAHKNGKCDIKVAGASIPHFTHWIKKNPNFGCDRHIDLISGTVEHYNNGHYI